MQIQAFSPQIKQNSPIQKKQNEPNFKGATIFQIPRSTTDEATAKATTILTNIASAIKKFLAENPGEKIKGEIIILKDGCLTALQYPKSINDVVNKAVKQETIPKSYGANAYNETLQTVVYSDKMDLSEFLPNLKANQCGINITASPDLLNNTAYRTDLTLEKFLEKYSANA